MGTRLRATTLLALSFTVWRASFVYWLVGPFLPGYLRDLGASDFVAISVGSAFAALKLASKGPLSSLAGLVGLRRALLASVAAASGGLLVLSRATSVEGVFAARMISGFAAANVMLLPAYAVASTQGVARPRTMFLLDAMFGVGLVSGPLVAAWIATDGFSGPPLRAAFWAGVLSLANCALLALFLPESPPGEPPAEAGPRWREILRAPEAVGALVASVARIVAFTGAHQSFRLLSADAYGLGVEGTGYLLALLAASMIASRGGLAGAVRKIVSDRGLLAWGLASEALGFALLAVSTAFPDAGPALAAAALACLGLGWGAAEAAISALSSEKDGPGPRFALLQNARLLAAVFGPLLSGAAYAGLGPAAPPAAAAALTAACFGTLAFFGSGRRPAGGEAGATPHSAGRSG